MGRTRYKIYEPTHPHFVTLSILHWIPIFTSKDSVRIVIDSLKYLQKEDKLKIYAYVILTAKELIELLKSKNITTLLEQFAFYKKKHKQHIKYQIWQEGIQPKLIQKTKI